MINGTIASSADSRVDDRHVDLAAVDLVGEVLGVIDHELDRRLRPAPGSSPSPSEQALSEIGVTQTYHR